MKKVISISRFNRLQRLDANRWQNVELELLEPSSDTAAPGARHR